MNNENRRLATEAQRTQRSDTQRTPKPRTRFSLCFPISVSSVSLWLFFFPGLVVAQDARSIVQEVQKRNRSESQRYEGTLQVIDNKKVTDKRWIYKRKGAFGDSKALLTFT